MKKSILLALTFSLTVTLYSQTATNWTCKDCSGVEHTLFDVLDSGKVVVIDWVMPCGPCAGPTITTHNVVQSYQDTHPGKVIMYVADDFADTPCISLASWLTGIGVTNVTAFSNAAINMNDYGSIGMPKVVVIGGPEYKVFYNANNSENHVLMQSAINEAIAATTVGVGENEAAFSGVSLYPNPTSSNSTLTFDLKEPSPVTIETLSPSGQLISQQIFSSPNSGRNTFEINTEALSTGIYFVRLRANDRVSMVKLAVGL